MMELTNFKKEHVQSKNHDITPNLKIHPKEITHSMSPRTYPYPQISGLPTKIVSLIDKQ